ncbi:phosphoglycerate mutase [Gorgonomyces haynaldii]|nr:phosphoglycerate mutase [Gorgonomyces haynaldii]
MTTRVFLIRHGSTELSAEDKFAGSTDVLLSQEGERQAQLLGKRLSCQKIHAFYCSPMKRTMKTAALVAQPHNLPVETVDAIREVDHGLWEQKTRDQVKEEFSDLYLQYEADPFTSPPPKGESGLQVLSRALPAFQDIVKRHPNQTIAIISHKATIRLLVSYFLGFDMRKYRDNLDQQPCCLNVLDFKLNPIQARLKLFNDVTHYEDQAFKQGEQRLSDFYCQ